MTFVIAESEGAGGEINDDVRVMMMRMLVKLVVMSMIAKAMPMVIEAAVMMMMMIMCSY